MEVFQNIWIALTSENEMLAKLILLPTIWIEAFVNMLLFTAILNISFSKKQALKYVLSISLLGGLSLTIIPQPFNTFMNMVTIPLLVHYFFKSKLFKSIFSEIIMFITTAILESILISVSNAFLILPHRW